MTVSAWVRALLQRPTRSLVARVVVSFAGLVLVVLGAVASVAFLLQRRSLEANALERLSAVAAVKEGEITRWIGTQRDLVVLLAGLSVTRDAAALLHEGAPDVEAALARLQGVVDRGAHSGSDLLEMFVLSTAGGRVLASSDPSTIGDFRYGEEYFERGKEGTFVKNVYPSPETAQPTLTVVAPVLDGGGEVAAVLGGHLNLNRLEEILSETSAVGRTAKAFPLTRYGDVISPERFVQRDLPRGLHTEGAKLAVSGEIGTAQYLNVDERPVLGAYRWMDHLDMGLVLEMDRAEALAPVWANLAGILGVGLLATLVLLLGVARIEYRVTRSLAQVSAGAAEVAVGDFGVEVDVHGEDEVGELARAFNAMSGRLRELYGDLQSQVEVNQQVLLALEEGRALLEAIVENSSALIAVHHPESGVVLANQALGRALGVTPERLQARRIEEFLPQGEAALYAAARDTSMRENRTLVRELPLRVEGEDRTYVAVWFPLRDAKGSPFSVGLIATDITERIRAEEERNRYEAQLRHAQKLESLGILAGGIAHDFNNILAAILGHGDLALETVPAGSEAAQHLEQVIIASQRAATLTNQMLAYAGRASFQVEVLDLNEAVEEVWSLLSVSMGKKVTLERDLSPSPCLVRADPAQVSQVVMNLVTNAGQAIGDASGTVTVRTSAEAVAGAASDSLHPGRYVRLSVRDTGCGMDEETVERIFDPFFTTKESGRGLGLAAVIGIVNGLGGGVRVDSDPGRGTTFEILLPEATQPRPRVSSEGSARRPAGPGGTVLVADDEEAVRNMARRVLERAGYGVLLAEDGVEAVRVYEESASLISAAVLDVSMPGLAGPEVFEELRKRTADLPVVFTTGYDPADAIRGLEGAGRVRFLQKPYRPAALAQALAGLLDPRA